MEKQCSQRYDDTNWKNDRIVLKLAGVGVGMVITKSMWARKLSSRLIDDNTSKPWSATFTEKRK
jgi:hypothetical protein